MYVYKINDKCCDEYLDTCNEDGVKQDDAPPHAERDGADDEDGHDAQIHEYDDHHDDLLHEDDVDEALELFKKDVLAP